MQSIWFFINTHFLLRKMNIFHLPYVAMQVYNELRIKSSIFES